MNVVVDGDRATARRTASSIQTYARLAGVLALLSLAAGGFGEAYVPAKLIVAGDAARTVENLKSSEVMFRLGFTAYLLEATCDVALALIFYVLLKPVHKYLSLLAAFFGLMATATFAAAELFYFAPVLILKGGNYLKSFSPDQLNALLLLSLKLFGLGAVIFTIFYGMAWVLRGYLIFQSAYLPKFLGVLMTVAGLSFIVSNFVVVLAPKYGSDWLLLLMIPGFLALTIWLLFKGVDLRKWEQSDRTRR
jgi:hypothetical protein